MDEQTLIQTAQKGDLEAFNGLVLMYQDLVYNQACYWMKDPDRAADITQDVFVKSFQALDSFRGGSFKAWLLRIMANTAMDELRRQQRHPMIPLMPFDSEDEEIESPTWLTEPGASPEEIAEQRVLIKDLQCELTRLPQDYRTVITLVDVEGLDYQETARVLGVPVGTIKSRLARGRMMLRERLAHRRPTVPTRVRPYELSHARM